MRIVEARGVEASHRSIVSWPFASSALCTVLLAFSGSESSGKPLASLALGAPQPDLAEFGVPATSLRLPPQDSTGVRTRAATALLRYASRNARTVRNGGSLLATPTSDADESELRQLGFELAIEGREDSKDPRVALAPSPLLAFVSRRDPSESLDGSHVALRVSSIKASIDFWSLFHFSPVRTFSTEGARAAWLSAPWTSLSLELIEVPALMLPTTPPPSDTALGLAHICLDVTPLGISLPTTLELLLRKSLDRYGRNLRVLEPPHQQMMGDLVAEVAVVRAPDAVQLELVHRAGIVGRKMNEDWRDHDQNSSMDF
jgi:catechol 2,3-dioxygenase-like lactoylglutathione lyase family enzyme